MLTGEPRALVKRGITEETCRMWGYHVATDVQLGEVVQLANYFTDSGEVVAQKLRTANKSFKFLGKPKDVGLYGQWLWRDGGKMLVITEGEIDALTVSQLQNNKWPVVSVPNGAMAASKDVAKAIEWVEKFDSVVLMFDDDPPGRDAAAAVAGLLTPGKAKVARIPGFKDANEALQAGNGKAVIDAIWGAKDFRPDGVVEIASLFENAFLPVEPGVPWPWKALTAQTYGIRTGEVYTLGAGVGIGKSDIFVKDVALHLVGLGHKVGIVALEEQPEHTTRMLIGKLIGKRLHVPGVYADLDELQTAEVILKDNVVLFDHFGAMDYETIKSRVKFMVQHYGARYIFVDHLTALAAAVDDDNERRAIDKMMADIASLAQQLDIAVFLISHLATPEGTPHEEGGRVLEKHFRGSRAIAQWSHFMFGLERNKQERAGITTFRVLKDRYTGDSAGLTFGLQYDTNTGRSVECALPTEGFVDETKAGGDVPW